MMQLIESIEQYTHLMAKSKGENQSVNINCYFFAEDLQRLIAKKRLFYQIVEPGVLVFLEDDRSYSMYLHINPEKEFFVESQNKPIVSEFLGSKELSNKLRTAADHLLRSGFAHSVTTMRMIARNGEQHMAAEETGSQYSVITAGAGHIDSIMAVWESSFDCVINRVPSRKELIEIVLQNHIICAIDKGERIIGVLQTEIEKGCGWCWHVAVLPEYRGKGVGRTLTLAYFDWCVSFGIKNKYLWVAKDNFSAIKLYSKYGYAAEDKICEQYILKATPHKDCACVAQSDSLPDEA